MLNRWLLFNVLLGVMALIFVAYIVRELVAPAPQPRVIRPLPVAPVAPATTTPPAPPGAYTVVTSRNLFSPTRNETGTGPAAGTPVVALPKPNLYGVVLRNGSPVAYLEDPVTKRVAGYRIGDAIAGGTLKSISADRVVLTRPEGNVDVQLHDPSRPRPPVAGVPGQPGVPPGVPGAVPSLPGVVPPLPVPTPPAPQAQTPQPLPGQPGVTPPFGRRPFRPNLLPPATGNAPTQ